MEFGFSQSVDSLLLDNIDKDVPITNSASSPVVKQQNFKEKMNSVFEKHDEVIATESPKEIYHKIFLSQYPPKSTYLQNEKNLICALKNHIVRIEEEFLFPKKEMETKNQLFLLLFQRNY